MAVVAELESLVMRADGDAGVRLPSERALAQQLGVSRASLREALQHLRARGMVLSKRGSGLYTIPKRSAGPLGWLAHPTPAERAEMFEIRLMIESAAAQCAAARATPVDMKALEEALDRLRHAIERQDVEQEADADARFHLALVAAAHNTLLKRLYLSLGVALKTHIERNTYEASVDRLDAAALTHSRLAQHEGIFLAIRCGDERAAQAAASTHIRFVERQFEHESVSGDVQAAAHAEGLHGEMVPTGSKGGTELARKS